MPSPTEKQSELDGIRSHFLDKTGEDGVGDEELVGGDPEALALADKQTIRKEFVDLPGVERERVGARPFPERGPLDPFDEPQAKDEGLARGGLRVQCDDVPAARSPHAGPPRPSLPGRSGFVQRRPPAWEEADGPSPMKGS